MAPSAIGHGGAVSTVNHAAVQHDGQRLHSKHHCLPCSTSGRSRSESCFEALYAGSVQLASREQLSHSWQHHRWHIELTWHKECCTEGSQAGSHASMADQQQGASASSVHEHCGKARAKNVHQAHQHASQNRALEPSLRKDLCRRLDSTHLQVLAWRACEPVARLGSVETSCAEGRQSASILDAGQAFYDGWSEYWPRACCAWFGARLAGEQNHRVDARQLLQQRQASCQHHDPPVAPLGQVLPGTLSPLHRTGPLRLASMLGLVTAVACI